MAWDLTVTLEDRPGELARLGEALGGAGVNIEGVCAVTQGGRGVVHLLVEDASAARAALEGTGLSVAGESAVLVLDLAGQDHPGTLGTTARKIADAGVNINLIYLAMGGRGVIGCSDLERARAALA